MGLFILHKKSYRKCYLKLFRDIKANSSKILNIRNIFLFLVFFTCLFLFYLHYKSIDRFLYEKKQSPGVFSKKGVLNNFTKFTGQHLCQSHFCLWHRCFHVKFTKFLRTPFLIEHLRREISDSQNLMLAFMSRNSFKKNFLLDFCGKKLDCTSK